MGPELGSASRYVKYYMSRDKIDVVRKRARRALRRCAPINIPPDHERDEPSPLRILREFCGHESTMLRRPTVPEPKRVDRRAQANDRSMCLGVRIACARVASGVIAL